MTLSEVLSPDCKELVQIDFSETSSLVKDTSTKHNIAELHYSIILISKIPE